MAAAVSDPLGELLGAGLGWLMEHLDPLHGWLNDLTGDAARVGAYAGTWQGLDQRLRAGARELDRVVRVDLEDMSGDAVAAYRLRAGEMSQVMGGLADNAAAIATGLGLASMIVQVVHDVVRDALAKVVGAAISWAAELVCSVGLATPLVIEQVTTRVASLAVHVGTQVTATITSSHALRDLLTQLTTTISALGHHLPTTTATATAIGAAHHGAGDLAEVRAASTDTGADAAGSLAVAPVVPPRSRTSRPSAVERGPLPSCTGVTRPSKAPDADAVARGRAELPSSRDRRDKRQGLSGEEESAWTMAQAGYDVDRHPWTEGPKNPDFRIEGQIFDNYTPTSNSARNIWSAVQDKILHEQTVRVVINLRDTAVTFEQLREQFRYPVEGLLEAIVVDGNRVRPLYP